jgi:hypothetical protein
MSTTTLVGRFAKAASATLLATTVTLLAAAPAFAGSNMAKVDIVKEGIDLAPMYVRADASGYTGTENDPHKFMVRVFAKAKGQNRVWAVSIYDHANGHKYFEQEVGKSAGWETYGKSHVLSAKPRDLKWITTPVEICREHMAEMIAEGKTKAQVLGNDRKVTAHTFIAFSAYADSKANNNKNKHNSADGRQAHSDNILYPVPVVCRQAL